MVYTVWSRESGATDWRNQNNKKEIKQVSSANLLFEFEESEDCYVYVYFDVDVDISVDFDFDVDISARNLFKFCCRGGTEYQVAVSE